MGKPIVLPIYCKNIKLIRFSKVTYGHLLKISAIYPHGLGKVTNNKAETKKKLRRSLMLHII